MRDSRKRVAILLLTGVMLLAVGLAIYAAGGTTEIRRGGTISVAIPGPVMQLDPHKVKGDEAYHATFHIFSALTRITRDFNAEPELADSWEHSADAKVWTFHINQNAYFTNGRQVTAEDVKFSLERVLDKEVCPRGWNAIGPIEQIEVIDKFTVVIKLTKSYLDLPVDLGGVYPRIVAKENIDQIDTNPIGSGPFKLKKWDPVGVTVLERNDNYFMMGEDGKSLPYIDEYRIVPIKENMSQLAALKSGDIDLVYRVSYDLISQALLDKQIVIQGTPTLGYQPIVLNLDPEIYEGQNAAERRVFRNDQLRQAFSYIIDRKAALQMSLSGYGIIGNDQPIPRFHVYGNPNEEQKTQDIELAKKLLAEAGVAPGTHFKMYTSPGRPGMMELAVAFQQMAREAGIVIDLEVIDISRYWADIEFKEPLMTSNWGGRQTVNACIKPYYHSEGGKNESHYSDPELDKVLEQAEGETDFEKRRELYWKAMEMVSESSATIIPYFKNHYMGLSQDVRGVDVHPMAYLWVDRAWFITQ
ncbi:MAG: ABC transporter substrate-binding protein [Candidatus Latescibacteria bacterium]|nr:ABC transporter substrate-binding protein [Candidatus Latescibacterota bacterium]